MPLYSMLKRHLAALLLVLSLPLYVQAMTIQIPQTTEIGQPFLVLIESPATLADVTVTFDGRLVDPAIRTEEGETRIPVLLGTGLKAETGHYPLEVTATVDGVRRRYQKTINVIDHIYPEETLSVAPRLVKPPKKYHEKIAQERDLIRQTLAIYSSQRYWDIPFSLPVKGKMLSRFGLRRTFNGDTKRRHTGLDFRAYMGYPLHAIAPGKVLLVGKNFYFAGNCVFIDHGNGVISLSAHMSKPLVKTGDMVKRGQRIGLSGATGRVTGAHLHLSVFVQGVSIDPEPLFAKHAKTLLK